ncbi:MAG: hypothetical protein HQL38_18630 [Alphaproteobacteria bacterium]|nr:hypothetical protein [Alphaproteobacteria bacterium]
MDESQTPTGRDVERADVAKAIDALKAQRRQRGPITIDEILSARDEGRKPPTDGL